MYILIDIYSIIISVKNLPFHLSESDMLFYYSVLNSRLTPRRLAHLPVEHSSRPIYCVAAVQLLHACWWHTAMQTTSSHVSVQAVLRHWREYSARFRGKFSSGWNNAKPFVIQKTKFRKLIFRYNQTLCLSRFKLWIVSSWYFYLFCLFVCFGIFSFPFPHSSNSLVRQENTSHKNKRLTNKQT